MTKLRLSAVLLIMAAACGLVGSVAVSSCSDNKIATNEKPKYLWMCGEANFDRFSNKDTITYYLEKARETGFNNVAYRRKGAVQE
jgi:hypothetical protein